MEFKSGYDARDYHHDGQEVIQSMKIENNTPQGKYYGRTAVELCDRVGRVIGVRVTSKLQLLKLGELPKEGV